MLTVCYSPKGGQGCTTVTAALAAHEPDALLIDIGGDLPALLGIPEPAGPGICDLLTTTDPIDARSLAAITIDAGPACLIHAGSTPPTDVHSRRWDELADTLRSSYRTVFLDAGTNHHAAVIADRRVMVVRACYLALRRAVAVDVRPDRVILIVEPGRALTTVDVEAALGVPVAAEIPFDPAISRAIDAGLFTARLPIALRHELVDLAGEPDAAPRV